MDAATGTCDLLISVLKHNKNIQKAIGTDLAQEMLSLGNQKIRKHKFEHIASTQIEDACKLSAADNTYDLITIGFGIRNVPDHTTALKEFHRVLKPNGTLIVLEFSIPSNKIIRCLYLFYFERIFTKIAGFISQNPSAYQYLCQTVKTFPYGSDFLNLMGTIGFQQCSLKSLTFGIATIYVGYK